MARQGPNAYVKTRRCKDRYDKTLGGWIINRVIAQEMGRGKRFRGVKRSMVLIKVKPRQKEIGCMVWTLGCSLSEATASVLTGS